MPFHIVQIEDNSPLRDVLRIALDAAEPGLVWAQFITGDAAVPYIQANAADIDLFIVDVHLHGYLSGLQLAFFIRSIHCPGFIVLTSAYGTPNQQVLSTLHSEFIAKPYHIPELTQNLYKYHIEKPNQSPESYIDAGTNSQRQHQGNHRSTELHLPATQPMRRATLSTKVATGEYKKVGVGSGLLHKLISKLRSL